MFIRDGGGKSGASGGESSSGLSLGAIVGSKGSRSGSIPRIGEAEVVSRLQNATQSVMGKISKFGNFGNFKF